MPRDADAVHPAASAPLSVTIDGTPVPGVAGQSLAGVLLASGRLSWRVTSVGGRPRGVFCGIGVCFDCLAEVNGLRDVRLCQRQARDGDVVVTQHDPLPEPPSHPDEGAR
ncbi:(2Fe-2S)-binding protein [Microbacterium paludicola]|nr:(2Fe-2S)-binding protein [Microbacterium paludicola]